MDALRTNERLKIVILNPDAKKILKRILYHAELALQKDRFFIVCENQRGSIETALSQNWLLQRVKNWLQNRFTPEEMFDFRKEVLMNSDHGTRTIGVATAAFPVKGITIDIMSNHAYLTRHQQPEIVKVNLDNWNSTIIPVRLNHLRGIAIEWNSEWAYVMCNRYQVEPTEFFLKRIENKSGAGRLWKINLNSGKVEPVTRIQLFKSAFELFSETDQSLSKLWNRIKGILRWPFAVIIECPLETLLITEARGLSRVNLRTGTISKALHIPFCFNLTDVVLESSDHVLLVDCGVSGTRYGRLMRGSLSSGTITEYLLEGINMNYLAVRPGMDRVLISQGGEFPRGRVFEFDLTNKKEIQSWEFMNQPAQICVEPQGQFALVATMDGLYRLAL